jgi:hypothetical protein
MQANQRSAKPSVRLLIAALLLSVNLSAAQQAQQSSSQQTQPPPSGVMIDPSAGPLKPSEPAPREALPAAPLPQPSVTAPPTQPPQSSQIPEQPAAPVGAAAAEQVRAAGGAASRPAGSAIAPVKQHQYRSILIKLGVVAAAGIAAGTVYGLSRATSSTPPHTTAAAAK